MHRITSITYALALVLALLAHRAVAQEGQAPTGQTPAPQPTGGTPVTTPDEMLDHALKLFDSGDLQEAATVTERVRRMKPDHPRILLIQALLLIESRRSADALDYLNKYNNTPVGSKDFRGYWAVGSIYRRSYAYPSAERPLEIAKRLAPAEVNGKPVSAEITIEYATVLQKRKKTKQAIAALKEAENLAPNDAGVQLHLGEASHESQENDAALRYANRAIELTMGQLRSDPFKKAELARLKDCNLLKIKAAQSQSAAKPDDAPPYFVMAEATMALADAERRINLLEARELALRALSKDPKQHSWRIFLAQIELDLGGIQDAIDHINEVLKEDPQNAAALKFRQDIQARMTPDKAP
ncbi:MAG TPA: tetratricopeptide repeat protein [Phycisphaerae bacterium]|nr:tetratricopeptide repeat protein [Phycisphaerae bacterium]